MDWLRIKFMENAWNVRDCVFAPSGSGGQSTQIKYLSKSTDTYNKILLQ